MKAMFSLVGLLIGVFILVYVWSQHTSTVSTASKQAMRDAQQFAGRDEDGVPAKESVKLEPFLNTSGTVKSILVANVTPGGPMETYYGLKRGDVIVTAGQMDLRGQDAEMAVELIHRAYQMKGELRVKRGLKEMMLPGGQVLSDATPEPLKPTAPVKQAEQPQADTTPTAGDHAKQPEAERPAGQQDTRSALQRQLDGLPGVRRSE